ncbi:MAG: pseudouridine synthase [Cellvibrionaceae bacterium]|nr:pseudouridine synthase [Cellvibrionaceae bacterium]
MRIDKFISNNSEYSRTQVRRLVKAGRVELNNEVVADASMKITGNNPLVSIHGQPLEAVGDVYYMLNKPKGYVCANSDGHYPTVIDLLADHHRSKGGRAPCDSGRLNALQVVGRLDVDTTGLVLLTNNGEWNHHMTSPKSNFFKCYQVSLNKAPTEATQKLFSEGLLLEGEKKKTKPAYLEFIATKKVRVSITEGKYHQVKRMFAAVGCRVRALHRESIGPIRLDAQLHPGEYRELYPCEVASVENSPLLTSEPL